MSQQGSDSTNLLLSGRYNLSAFDPFNEETMAVQYKLEEEYVESNPTTNVIIAA